jgi:hypothetical protein
MSIGTGLLIFVFYIILQGFERGLIASRRLNREQSARQDALKRQS